jgi:hypothetical protein
MSSRGRESVLSYLRRNGGDVFSADGRGITVRMAAAIGYQLGSLGRLLIELEQAGLIEREVRGKRTFRIRLREGVEAPASRAAAPTKPIVPVSLALGPGRGEMQEVLNLLIEVGVLERNFERTIERIEGVRREVDGLMRRCQEQMVLSSAMPDLEPVAADRQGASR